MNIYGSSGSLNRLPTQAPVRDNARTPTQKSPTSMPAPAQTIQQTNANAKAAPSAQGVQSSVPVEPPPGTDPALWSILSGEERAFFAKAGTMGPLTYGRAFNEMKAAQPPVARGGRLDVKI